jgi:hypothetical protein
VDASWSAATESNLTPGYQIAAAIFIPVAVAVITGTFALMNARTDPSVKLKNLVDASKEVPSSIHAKYALERLILREIGRLDLTTSRWYKRTIGLTLLSMISIVLVLFAIQHSALLHLNPRLVAVGANLLASVIGAISGFVFSRQYRQHREPYNIRLDALKMMEDREVTMAKAIKDGDADSSARRADV